MDSSTRELEKTDRFAPQHAEKMFACGAALLAALSIAGYFFGEYMTLRQLLSVLTALVLSQLNFRSWRVFVEAAGVSLLNKTPEGRLEVIARLIELVALKAFAIALLILLYLDGGVAAIELTLITLVVYLITGALMLALSTWRAEQSGVEPAESD